MCEKIKVLFIVSSLERCGPNNQLLYLVKNLHSTSIQPVIFTLNSESENTLINAFRSIGVTVYQSQIVSRFRIIKILSTLLVFVSKIKPDVIHTQSTRPDLISGIFLNRFKRISTLRSFPQDDYGMTYNFFTSQMLLALHKIVFARMDAVVGVSRSVSKNLSNLMIIKNLRTIENSFQKIEAVPTDRIENTEAINSLGLEKDSIIFLSVGGLIPRKDPIWLINFWLNNFGNEQSYQLLFLGDGPLISECKRLASRSSNITILGDKTDVFAYYSLADVFISTSHAEGMPNAVLEALWSGKTCILSSIDPHKNVDEKMTSGIILFDLKNERALKRIISDLDLLKIRSSICEISQEVDKEFSAYDMANKYRDLYHEVVQKSE